MQRDREEECLNLSVHCWRSWVIFIEGGYGGENNVYVYKRLCGESFL